MNAPYQPYLEIIRGRVHNLKDVTLRLPHYKLIVVTGVSGSGKSSLIFHLVYAESHRRYMSTLESSFIHNVDALEKPDVDQIKGLQAVIGIGQELSSSRTLRSTVGTITDIYAFLRLLYARVADAFSYLNGKKMVQQSEEEIHKHIMGDYAKKTISFLAPLATARKGTYKNLFALMRKKNFHKVIIDGKMHSLKANLSLDRYKKHDIQLVVASDVVVTTGKGEAIQKIIAESLHYGKGSFAIQCSQEQPRYFSRFFMDPTTGLAYRTPVPSTFSFNAPEGACGSCQGFGFVHAVDKKKLIPDSSKNIASGGIPLLGSYRHTKLFKSIEKWLGHYGYSLDKPLETFPKGLLDALLHGASSGKYNKPSPKLASYLVHKLQHKNREAHDVVKTEMCPACQGQRLKKESLHFKIGGKSIGDVCMMNLKALYAWLQGLPKHLTPTGRKIARQILEEVKKRVKLLIEMGLYYLNLGRSVQTLSSGEMRRVRIATQIGTQDTHLVGVMYVLDEPSIGLHAADNQKLIQALQRLRDLGNTVIVIEHDRDTMLAADYLVEVGPGAGVHGGEIVAAGTGKQFLQSSCATTAFLSGERAIPVPTTRRKGNQKFLTLTKCTGFTLKNVHVRFPLGTFIVVTGVSGSGKSSLVHGTLVPAIKKHLGQVYTSPLPHGNLEGFEHITKVIEVTHAPIGRTQRSTVATYTRLFGGVRDLFTQLPQSKIRGYKVQRFSFNVQGGRCEACKGVGAKTVEMDFLADISIECEVCRGRFYNRETLEVHYKGKSIADVLGMTVTEAIDFFEHHPIILKKLHTLEAVGLGYIHLGQRAPTLSGGEAQRIKLAMELSKKDTGDTLYILDEPTTGLHFQDVQHLVVVLQKLVDKGNTVICIEHNMDLIKNADYIIDMGPSAGEEGGRVVAAATPEEILQHPTSKTAVFLKKELSLHQSLG